MIEDYNIAWKRKRVYYPIFRQGGLIPFGIDEQGVNSYSKGQLLGGNSYVDPLYPNPYMKVGDVNRNSTLGLYLLDLVSVGDISKDIPLPYDIDVNFPFGGRINWTQSLNITKGIIFNIGIAMRIKNGSLGDYTIADNKLTLKSFTNGLAWENLWTSRMEFKNSITRKKIEDGSLLFLVSTISTIDPEITTPLILGIELDYVSRLTIGEGMDVDPMIGNIL